MQYQDINTIVAKNDAELSAAEAHGTAAGMLCVNDRTEFGFWLQELLKNADEMGDEGRSILKNLFEDTRESLSSDEFAFGLLLPDDGFPLYEQVDALRKWCQGFLFGLGSTFSTSDSTPNWPAEIREVVKDIAEFTKLDTEAEDEDAENDFMEITEYLRAAVIFLRTELNSANKRTVH